MKEGAKGQLHTRQPSLHEINRWFSMEAVRQNLKPDTTTTSKAIAENKALVPLKAGAKGQLHTRQPSLHEINRQFSMEAVRQNLKPDTTTTSKA